ncbi:hypothetical protein GJAV_G00089220 [Gymnothorax javanicus]|nr:hypothetical protein GJAV_G00089220 [Gymnothorax javanicus]
MGGESGVGPAPATDNSQHPPQSCEEGYCGPAELSVRWVWDATPTQVVIPARVLWKWDFHRFPVSNFARDLLSAIAAEPLFNVAEINCSLYGKVKALQSVRILRMQLVHMKILLETCQSAKDVHVKFEALPAHLSEDVHLYSLDDLAAVRHGDLVRQLRDLLRLGSVHMAACQQCMTSAVVCEFCGSKRKIVFPLELKKCQHCENELPLVTGGPLSVGTALAHSWKDWRFPLPGRLAKSCSQERRGGEGGLGGDECPQEEGTNRTPWKGSHVSQIAEAFSVEIVKGQREVAEDEDSIHTDSRRLLFGGLVKMFSRDRGGSVEEGLVQKEGVQQAEVKNDRVAESQTEKKNCAEPCHKKTASEKRKLFRVLQGGQLSITRPRDRNTSGQDEAGETRGGVEGRSECSEGSDTEAAGRLEEGVSHEECQMRASAGKDEAVTSNKGVKGESNAAKFWSAPKSRHLPKIFHSLGREEKGVGLVAEETGGVLGETEGSGDVVQQRGPSNWRLQKNSESQERKELRSEGRNERCLIYCLTAHLGGPFICMLMTAVSTHVCSSYHWLGYSDDVVFAICWFLPGRMWMNLSDQLLRDSRAVAGCVRSQASDALLFCCSVLPSAGVHSELLLETSF